MGNGQGGGIVEWQPGQYILGPFKDLLIAGAILLKGYEIIDKGQQQLGVLTILKGYGISGLDLWSKDQQFRKKCKRDKITTHRR